MSGPPRNPSDPDPSRPNDDERELDLYAETFRKPEEKAQSLGQIPDRIGRFEIRKRLGAGTFGAVYLAYDTTLDREVAIKVPRGDYSEETIQSFLAEAKNLAKLRHPGIVSIYDVGREGSRCFIVTEYLEGSPLRDYVKNKRLDWLEAVQIVSHLADSLAHAHSRGIMHRDIKPTNIMMSEGRCVLLDFGLAVNDLQSSQIEYAGTPNYMAPEQIRGEAHRVDGRTDIFALGIVLYELLTGRCPFRAEEISELFRKILEDAPQPIRQLNPDIPPSIDEICRRALQKDLTRRFTTAGDFAQALRDAVAPLVHPRSSDSASGSSLMPVTEDSVSRQSTFHLKYDTADSSHLRRLREAELRLVTLLGVDFDEYGDHLDAESQHVISEKLTRMMESLAEKYGGRLGSSSGSEFEICFGFPVAHEDSVSRAVHCGMEVLALAESDPDLPDPGQIVAAVHLGRAVAEESTHGVKVTGEVSHTLRRLMSAIDPGVVVVTEHVHKVSRMTFEHENLGEVSVRGLSAPISLYAATHETSVTLNRVELVDPENLTPLIGRDTELSILRDRWEQANEGMGQIVLLIGEAGLGKSRLIREIREDVASEEDATDIIELRCSQYHQSAGLYPLVEHLKQYLKFDEHVTTESRLIAIERFLGSLQLGTDRNVALLSALLNVVGESVPELDIPPQRMRELTTEFLLDLLKQRSELHPILFIVEDLHWIDPTLLELLSAYVEDFQQHRALSLFTFRPEFETPWKSRQHLSQIALNRLTRRQIRDMVGKRFDRTDLPQEVVEHIAERTDGIPLFIEEFSNLLAESGALDGDSVTEALLSQAIPASLQDLLMARLDRMSSNPEVVQLAAAIGREFSFPLLAAASDLPTDLLQEELNKLANAQVLFQKGKYPDASFIFKHALIQDSAYNSLLKKRRQYIHSRIGTALEESFPEVAAQQPELLAHHFAEADDPEKSVEYWLQAGTRAQAMSANIEAISHLTRGLEILHSLDESLERDQLELGFQTTLGPVLMAARGWSAPEVGVAIRRALQLCSKIGTITDQFFVMWGLWGWHLIRADMDRCEEVANDIVQLVENSAEGDELLSELHWVTGSTAYYKGDFKTAVELLKCGLELVDPEKERLYTLKTGQCCSVMCRSHVALSLWQLGYPDQALQLVEKTTRLARKLDHPFSYAMSLFFWRQILQFIKRDDLVPARVEAEYEICHEHGFVFFEVHAIFARGELLLKNGKVKEAREQLALGLELLKATGGNVSMDHPYRQIAEAFLSAGRLDDASEWLDRGFDLVENHHSRGMESEFLRLRGELALAAGDEVTAEKCFARAMNVANRKEARSWELRAAISFAELKKRQHKQHEACQLLESTYSFFSEGFETSDLLKAKCLLDELENEA